jgi:hypothetical protein
MTLALLVSLSYFRGLPIEIKQSGVAHTGSEMEQSLRFMRGNRRSTWCTCRPSFGHGYRSGSHHFKLDRERTSLDLSRGLALSSKYCPMGQMQATFNTSESSSRGNTQWTYIAKPYFERVISSWWFTYIIRKPLSTNIHHP